MTDDQQIAFEQWWHTFWVTSTVSPSPEARAAARGAWQFLTASPSKDEARYRWLNKQHNFLIYIEDEKELRQNVRLRCGPPLDDYIDNRIKEQSAADERSEKK
jgi:hypothetical protein